MIPLLVITRSTKWRYALKCILSEFLSFKACVSKRASGSILSITDGVILINNLDCIGYGELVTFGTRNSTLVGIVLDINEKR